MSDLKRKIRCPHCKTETVYSTENPFRPFCSERCQTIDLGGWASEQNRIPGQPIPAVEGTAENSQENQTEDAPPPRHLLN